MRESRLRFVAPTVAVSVYFAVVLGLCLGLDACVHRKPEPPPTAVERSDVGPGVLLILTEYTHGGGVLVSPTHAVTARHVVSAPSGPYENILVMGIPAKVEAVYGDTALLALDYPAPYTPAHRGMAVPETGEAFVYVWSEERHVIERKRIEILASYGDLYQGIPFTGWAPFHGSSGSPVIQKGRLVGVISSHGFGEVGMFTPVWQLGKEVLF